MPPPLLPLKALVIPLAKLKKELSKTLVKEVKAGLP